MSTEDKQPQQYCKSARSRATGVTSMVAGPFASRELADQWQSGRMKKTHKYFRTSMYPFKKHVKSVERKEQKIKIQELEETISAQAKRIEELEKCPECNGTGEHEINVDGMDGPCFFWGGVAYSVKYGNTHDMSAREKKEYSDGKDYSELQVSIPLPESNECVYCGSNQVTLLKHKDICHECGYVYG